MTRMSHWETQIGKTGKPVSAITWWCFLDTSHTSFARFKMTHLLTRLDDAAVYDGAPVGVQIVGRKFEEEKCLAIARIIYAVIQSANKG